MSETIKTILLIFFVIGALFFALRITGWKMKKAADFIIRDLKLKKAFDPASAVELSYAKGRLLHVGLSRPLKNSLYLSFPFINAVFPSSSCRLTSALFAISYFTTSACPCPKSSMLTAGAGLPPAPAVLKDDGCPVGCYFFAFGFGAAAGGIAGAAGAFVSSSSTSKISVAPPGMTGGRP